LRQVAFTGLLHRAPQGWRRHSLSGEGLRREELIFGRPSTDDLGERSGAVGVARGRIARTPMLDRTPGSCARERS